MSRVDLAHTSPTERTGAAAFRDDSLRKPPKTGPVSGGVERAGLPSHHAPDFSSGFTDAKWVATRVMGPATAWGHAGLRCAPSGTRIGHP
jgi:hypothetical protein